MVGARLLKKLLENSNIVYDTTQTHSRHGVIKRIIDFFFLKIRLNFYSSDIHLKRNQNKV